MKAKLLLATLALLPLLAQSAPKPGSENDDAQRARAAAAKTREADQKREQQQREANQRRRQAEQARLEAERRQEAELKRRETAALNAATKFDTDNSRSIDGDEIDAVNAALKAAPNGPLSFFDRNHNGRLDKAELATIKLPPHKTAPAESSRSKGS